ncbi:ataxin-7-like protein 1 [Cyprinodon tularosa]|uniref:ataxin-7-like protein 1 n=1 Tax=Cyprinodon tularosa TaxID=77115 RepID=UPI0018E24C5C|nr:ataxin-7-like protein 1 [Cyprinodon tularosa]XP_038128219.1 ataxin-7-like protein 1 [Cyprinodon tularosa]
MHSKNQKRHSSPIPSRSPLVPMKPKAPAVAPSPGDTLAFRVPKDYPHSRFNKAPLAVYPPKGARNKTCVSLPVVSLEKMPCLNRADSASHVRLNSSSSSSSSTLSPLKSPSFAPPASQRSNEKLVNGRPSGGPSTPRSITPPSSLDRRPSPARSPLERRGSSTPSPSPMDRKPSLSPSPSHRSVALPTLSSLSPMEKKQQNGAKAPARPHKRVSGRVFDPDKHCGVPDPETKRSCTRSLTCKTHSLTQRRAVPGRSRLFDELLAEHKGLAKEREALKEKEREAALRGKEGCSQSNAAPETPSPSKTYCPAERPLSSLKLRLANAHIPRVLVGSSSISSSSPLPPAVPPAVVPVADPSSNSWGNAAGDSSRLSSDEGDPESPDDTDRPLLHYSSHHPRPLGLCVFSSRLMGQGYYVFDRRWVRMRLALQTMVEKHLNAQMWRKVPLAAESLPSLSTSSTSLVTAQQAPSSTPIASPVPSSPSNTLTYTATFPQSASAAGVFNVRDSAQSHSPAFTQGKARNGSHKASRPSKDASVPSAGQKKRKNSSHSSSSFSSSSFQTVDVHKRNGSRFHPTLPGYGIARSSPAKNKGPQGGNGRLSSSDNWLSRADGSQGINTQNCRELGTSSITFTNREPASAPHQPMAPPTGPLAYGGGAEGRKRRSPSSYKGKASKLSRPGGLESLFGEGNDGGGILALGHESPRQAKLNH